MPKAVGLTETIAKQYKNEFDRLVLTPSSGGVFEIRLNGEEVYSKRATGEFPEPDAIVEEVGRRLGSAPVPGSPPVQEHAAH